MESYGYRPNVADELALRAEVTRLRAVLANIEGQADGAARWADGRDRRVLILIAEMARAALADQTT